MAYEKVRDSLFSRLCRDRTSIVVKLKGNRFRLDIRENSFTMRTVKHRNRLPKEVMDALSMGTFKVKMTLLTWIRTL